MDLFETPENPAPPDALVSVVRTRDGLRLRVARWSRPSMRGTVLIAAGRSESIEHYFEVIASLLARRFAVVAFDWRGQGSSDRETRRRGRGHVSSFAAYHRDLQAVEDQILKPNAPRPWFAYGHSMGAAILLEQAHASTSPFERLVLSAPMIGLPLRYKPGIRAVIRVLNLLGLGTAFIPGGSKRSLIERGFDGNLLTHDQRHFARVASIQRQNPKMTVGSPTVRWVASAFDLIERFADPRFSVETTVPILIVAAGADRIVDTAATERFAIRLKAGRCVTLPAARHQIFMERPDILAQFWAAFDAFIPGETAAATRPAEPVEAPGRHRFVDPFATRLRRWVMRLARGRAGSSPRATDPRAT